MNRRGLFALVGAALISPFLPTKAGAFFHAEDVGRVFKSTLPSLSDIRRLEMASVAQRQILGNSPAALLRQGDWIALPNDSEVYYR